MRLLDREPELARLNALCRRPEGGLAVLWGRRRIGKSRLLAEWVAAHDGIHFVADQSTATMQIRYFAHACSRKFPGFDEVDYPDWIIVLRRLAEAAQRAGWRGPLVFDELPYLAAAYPPIGSILQRWIDTDARQAGLVTAVCGSSQRMMQGLVLDANAPLFGRAAESFTLRELPAAWLLKAFPTVDAVEACKLHALLGGIPYYWELGAASGLSQADDLADRLVIDPQGPLHTEPQRLLREESPPAIAVQPILEAIGLGAHRLSEIAGKIGQPATALGHPLKRLLEMGLIAKDIPFGETEKNSKRSLYAIQDPLCRLWFTVIAPNRGALLQMPQPARRKLWSHAAPSLYAQNWEALCRQAVPRLAALAIPQFPDMEWGVASRWWQGNAPEWDIVAQSLDGRSILLGEAKWSTTGTSQVKKAIAALQTRPLPPLPGIHEKIVKRAVFVPKSHGNHHAPEGMAIIDADDIMKCLI
jgi:AAA+ ATPase superfamily predicted ATPase